MHSANFAQCKRAHDWLKTRYDAESDGNATNYNRALLDLRCTESMAGTSGLFGNVFYYLLYEIKLFRCSIDVNVTKTMIDRNVNI